jgi:hypothetical protein
MTKRRNESQVTLTVYDHAQTITFQNPLASQGGVPSATFYEYEVSVDEEGRERVNHQKRAFTTNFDSEMLKASFPVYDQDTGEQVREATYKEALDIISSLYFPEATRVDELEAARIKAAEDFAASGDDGSAEGFDLT